MAAATMQPSLPTVPPTHFRSPLSFGRALTDEPSHSPQVDSRGWCGTVSLHMGGAAEAPHPYVYGVYLKPMSRLLISSLRILKSRNLKRRSTTILQKQPGWSSALWATELF
jgi:hypothetical protein